MGEKKIAVGKRHNLSYVKSLTNKAKTHSQLLSSKGDNWVISDKYKLLSKWNITNNGKYGYLRKA